MSRLIARAKKKVEGSLLALPETLVFHVKRGSRNMCGSAYFCREGAPGVNVLFHVKQLLL